MCVTVGEMAVATIEAGSFVVVFSEQSSQRLNKCLPAVPGPAPHYAVWTQQGSSLPLSPVSGHCCGHGDGNHAPGGLSAPTPAWP